MSSDPFVSDPDFTLHVGDVREVLRDLPDESVDCALTSPPFFGLRDYGVEHQIGLEATPDEWVAELVGVFAEVRRTLKPHGTLWIECGDSYAASMTSDRRHTQPTTRWAGSGIPATNREPQMISRRTATGQLKPKDLLGQPWLLAFALRADGWWLRQAIIWHKPNVMPESATDRPTTSHSYIFLLSKRPRYYFDGLAIGEEFSENTHSRGTGSQQKVAEPGSGTRNNSDFQRYMRDLPNLRRVPQAETLDGSSGETPRGPDGRRQTHVKGGENSLQHRNGDRWPHELRHPRSVWTIPTQSFNEAHFATWPEAICERIIKAGCPAGGTVLDPFMGSGTTALVARRLGRKSIGIELNPEYAKLAAKRLQQLSLLADAEAVGSSR